MRAGFAHNKLKSGLSFPLSIEASAELGREGGRGAEATVVQKQGLVCKWGGRAGRGGGSYADRKGFAKAGTCFKNDPAQNSRMGTDCDIKAVVCSRFLGGTSVELGGGETFAFHPPFEAEGSASCVSMLWFCKWAPKNSTCAALKGIRHLGEVEQIYRGSLATTAKWNLCVQRQSTFGHHTLGRA